MQAIAAFQERRWSDRLRGIENGYLFNCMLSACKDIVIYCDGSTLQGFKIVPTGYEDDFVEKVELTFHSSMLANMVFLEAALVRAAVLICGGTKLDAIALSKTIGITWSDDGDPAYAKDKRVIRSGRNANVFWGRYVWWDTFEGLIGILGDDPYDLADVINVDELGTRPYNRRWYCPECVI